MGIALERLTNVRVSDNPLLTHIPNLDSQLWYNQHAYFTSGADSQLTNYLTQVIHSHFSDLPTYCDTFLPNANQSHVKRKLRVNAVNLAVPDKGIGLNYDGSYRLKVKPLEDAKPGKRSRMVGDLGVELSLVGGYVMACAKQAIYGRHVFNISGKTVCLYFSKDSSEANILGAFQLLMHHEYDFSFSIFSDDFCVSTKSGFMANLDITSCDSSHGPDIFRQLTLFFQNTQYYECVVSLVDQCRHSMDIKSLDHRHKVKLKPHHPTLWSGSTLTTFINTISVFNLCLSIVTYFIQTNDAAFSEKHCVMGSFKVGYLVTVDLCPTYHRLQFLKHSPCLSIDGNIVSVKNLGVILRSLGKSRGPPPSDNYYKLNREAAMSMEHSGNHRLTNAIRRKWGVDQMFCDYVDDGELLARYGIGDYALLDIVAMYDLASVGDVICSHYVDVILNVDYGYPISY